MRFPRKCNINQSADFIRIRKTGQAKAGRFVIVSTLPDPKLDSLRAAFITSKRAAKKAHDRNRIRRRLRACLSLHLEHLNNPQRYIVTIARSEAAKATYAEIEADWLKQCRRLGILP